MFVLGQGMESPAVLPDQQARASSTASWERSPMAMGDDTNRAYVKAARLL